MSLSESIQERRSYALSRYPVGSFKELVSLSVPMLFILLPGSLMGYVDRLFLAHLSLEALKGSVIGSSWCHFFQISLIFCAMTAQIFVSQCFGAGQLERIGRFVWQMIWIAFFLGILVAPLGFFLEKYFFEGASTVVEGRLYCRTLLLFTCFYPLGAALSCFYIGQGKMRLIIYVTLIANALNILLDPILIFGIPGYFPPLGILGAALATGISQIFFCVLLFCDFLRAEYRQTYGTGNFRLCKNEFIESIKISIPRAVAKATVLSAWVANVRLLNIQGGDCLLVLSMGSTLLFVFSFLADAMRQGVTTVASYMVGQQDEKKIGHLITSAVLFLTASSVIVFIPCIVFSTQLQASFFKTPLTVEQFLLLKKTCFWVWVHFIAFGINSIAFALLTALGDTLFTMLYNIASAWGLNYLPVLLLVGTGIWSSDKIYLIGAIGILISAIVYFYRFRSLPWRPLLSSTSKA